MPTFVLPNPNGSNTPIYANGNNLQEAEQNAAQAAGLPSWTGGSFGANSSVSGSDPNAGGGSGGTEYYTTGQHNAAMDANQAAADAATKAYQEAQAQNMSDTLAFNKAKEAATEAMQALTLSAQLRGPRNAFQQQQVNYGLNAAGFSPLAGALAGQYSLPTFQAPQATPQPANLNTLAQDISGGTGFTNSAGTVNQGATNQFLNSLPAPNQIVASQWNALPQDTQQFLLSGYEAKGVSANDVTDAISKGLPTFKAPQFAAADSAAN